LNKSLSEEMKQVGIDPKIVLCRRHAGPHSKYKSYETFLKGEPAFREAVEQIRLTNWKWARHEGRSVFVDCIPTPEFETVVAGVFEQTGPPLLIEYPELFRIPLRSVERLSHLVGKPILWGSGKKAWLQHLDLSDKTIL
jgi:hypothetical protein